MSTRDFTKEEEECSTSATSTHTSREGELATIETNSTLIHFPSKELISREAEALTTRDQEERINIIRDKLKVFKYTPRDKTRQGEETMNPTFSHKMMKKMNTREVEEMKEMNTREVEELTANKRDPRISSGRD